MTALEIIRIVGQEFEDVENGVIDQWIEIFAPMVSKKQFGKLYEQALAFLVCHKMKIAGLGDNAFGGEVSAAASGFSVASVSDGGSSISFANTGSGNLTTDAEFGMTSYGTQYLQLRKMCVIPIHVSGEESFYGGI